MSERCQIFIDGSNFYFKLKELEITALLEFNFGKFAHFLAGNKKLVAVNYYVGRVRQDGSKQAEKLLANQQKLLAALKKQKVNYSLGYLLKSNGKYHEKGVDVQIAVDMLIAAYEDRCERLILVSSDTDLAPAIKQVQAKKKIVEYVGFSHLPSIAMVRFCKQSHVLRKEDLLPFIL